MTIELDEDEIVQAVIAHVKATTGFAVESDQVTLTAYTDNEPRTDVDTYVVRVEFSMPEEVTGKKVKK